MVVELLQVDIGISNQKAGRQAASLTLTLHHYSWATGKRQAVGKRETEGTPSQNRDSISSHS
jgi:hypothetical protein